MRTPRLYLGTDLAPGTSHALDAEQSRHISQVLRLRRGQNLLVFDGQGKEYLASLPSVSKRECAIQVGQMQRVEPAPRLKLRLWLGISKGDRMDFAIQKAVELGISSIVPVSAEVRMTASISKSPASRRVSRRPLGWPISLT